MSRAKKDQNKPKEAATITIDVEDFVRTRDSVVTGLTTLQDVIRTISSAYIKHTNAILGDHGSGSDVAAALERLGDNPLLKLGGNLAEIAGPAKAASEAPAVGPDGKKERKKRQHDPDAPKRPLTPFFLYMQTARPIIAGDLGPEVPKGAVSVEGTQRWANMAAEDKQLWTNAYRENLRLYNARMHFYKRGFKEAKDMSDEDASNYAEKYNIGGEAGAEAQLVGEAAATHDEEEDAEGEPEKEATPPPVKTPKAKAVRKGKATKAAAVEEAASDPAAPTPSSIVPPKSAETPKSPDKKRKRASKKGAAEEAKSPEKAVEEPVETPAKSASKQPRKKKAKGDS